MVQKMGFQGINFLDPLSTRYTANFWALSGKYLAIFGGLGDTNFLGDSKKFLLGTGCKFSDETERGKY